MMKKNALMANLAISVAGAIISGFALALSPTNRLLSLVYLLMFIVVLIVSAMGLSSKEIGEDELDVIHQTLKK